jgi:hypothetical protein
VNAALVGVAVGLFIVFVEDLWERHRERREIDRIVSALMFLSPRRQWRPRNPGPTAAFQGARTTPAGPQACAAQPPNHGRHAAPPTCVPTVPTRRDWS